MPFTVTTYESAAQLETAIGNPVFSNLDNKQLEDIIDTDDTVICGGGLYTLIQGGLAAGVLVLAKGVYYTVIVETA